MSPRRLIPRVLRVTLGLAPHVTIFGEDYATPDGTCVRDYVHVVDLAHAHLLVLITRLCGGCNLGIGKGFSVREVVEAAQKVTGHAIPLVVGSRRPGDPNRLVDNGCTGQPGTRVACKLYRHGCDH